MIPVWITGPLGRWLIAVVATFLVMLAVFHRGMLHERAGWQARAAHAAAEARATERTAAALGSSAEREALAATRKQKETADAELAILRAQLARLPRCTVPQRIVRVLDGERAAVPATAGPAAGPGSAAAPLASHPAAGAGLRTRPAGSASLSAAAAPAAPAAEVDAAAVLENCAWNRLHVAEPNAVQIEQLQHYYNALRDLLNHP